jgi:hypothetical protein
MQSHLEHDWRLRSHLPVVLHAHIYITYNTGTCLTNYFSFIMYIEFSSQYDISNMTLFHKYFSTVLFLISLRHFIIFLKTWKMQLLLVAVIRIPNWSKERDFFRELLDKPLETGMKLWRKRRNKNEMKSKSLLNCFWEGRGLIKSIYIVLISQMNEDMNVGQPSVALRMGKMRWVKGTVFGRVEQAFLSSWLSWPNWGGLKMQKGQKIDKHA